MKFAFLVAPLDRAVPEDVSEGIDPAFRLHRLPSEIMVTPAGIKALRPPSQARPSRRQTVRENQCEFMGSDSAFPESGDSPIIPKSCAQSRFFKNASRSKSSGLKPLIGPPIPSSPRTLRKTWNSLLRTAVSPMPCYTPSVGPATAPNLPSHHRDRRNLPQGTAWYLRMPFRSTDSSTALLEAYRIASSNSSTPATGRRSTS